MAETQRKQAQTAEPEGTAGYVSPYPYVERLQEKMEERLAKRVPVKGRFCGYCYARLRPETTTCPYCERSTDQVGTVEEIPQDVLRAYLAKQKTEARWVHMGAFTGLLIAMALFLYLVVWGPGILGHPAVGFGVLIIGAYPLAQLFGPILAGQVGYRRGAKKRDELWAKHLAMRDGSPPPLPRAGDGASV